jgi:hypothetical protein
VQVLTAGFFLFETRDSLNMFLAHGIVEETLLQHHLLGIALYVIALYWQNYLYLACVVLIEARLPCVFFLRQEFTAPFTHFGWMLTKCRMDNHWLWVLNQVGISFALFPRNSNLLVLFDYWLGPISHLYGHLHGLPRDSLSYSSTPQVKDPVQFHLSLLPLYSCHFIHFF